MGSAFVLNNWIFLFIWGVAFLGLAVCFAVFLGRIKYSAPGKFRTARWGVISFLCAMVCLAPGFGLSRMVQSEEIGVSLSRGYSRNTYILPEEHILVFRRYGTCTLNPSDSL